MPDDPMRKKVAQTAEAHGLGWVDNGTDDARCYCGYVPRLGESWHWHVADAVIRELDAVPQRIMLSHASQAAESNRLDTADWLERELASVGLECGAGWVLYNLVDGVIARLNGVAE